MADASSVIATFHADPAACLVALDFDGTLSEVIDRPDDARPVPGVHEVLTRLAERVGTLALISGRPAAGLVQLAGVGDIRGLRVLGHYGLECWCDGRLESPEPVPGIAVVRRELAAALADAPDGVFVEDKHHSLVVHTRGAAEPQRALDDLAPRLRGLAKDNDLEVVPGRFVLELRPPGIDKGSALQQLIDEAQPRAVVYAGDDLGDLPAFAVTRSFRGPSLTVASDTEGTAPEVIEAADLVLDGPTAVITWLRSLLGS